MNPRATVALFLAALLLVGGLVYLRINLPTTREAGEAERYAAVFTPEEVTEMDIIRGSETISLRRENNEWRLTAPVADRADAEAVDRLLLAARFLGVRDREMVADPAAVPETGLASPRLRLDLRGREALRLDLGANTALPGEIFARLGGERAILRVSDSIVALATAPVENFRDPRLTTMVADDIEKFTVRRADGEMALRRERGRWVIEKPVRSPADARAVREFLEPLLGLRITGFKPPQTGTSSLAGAAAGISFTPRGGGEALDLEVAREQTDGAETFTAQLKPRGGTLAVDPAVRRLFDISPEALRDRSLGWVEADTVDRIRLESDGQMLNFRRTNDGWVAEEDGRKIGTDAVNRLMETFNAARVASFRTAASPAETGLDQPPQRITFSAWLSENTAEEPAGGQVLAGAALGGMTSDGTVYARAEGSDETVTITPDLGQALHELTHHNQKTPPVP
ncbi:MAG: DUF4340 domain-containing protein [Chthoniobacterales bacterium]